MVFITGSEESGAKPLSPLSVCVVPRAAEARSCPQGRTWASGGTNAPLPNLTHTGPHSGTLPAGSPQSDSLVHFLWAFTLGSNGTRLHSPCTPAVILQHPDSFRNGRGRHRRLKRFLQVILPLGEKMVLNHEGSSSSGSVTFSKIKVPVVCEGTV